MTRINMKHKKQKCSRKEAHALEWSVRKLLQGLNMYQHPLISDVDQDT